MPHTAANFRLVNASPADIINFNTALAYLDRSFTGNVMLNQLQNSFVTINFNHNGTDRFEAGNAALTGVLNWDPNAAHGVMQNGSSGTNGVQSAALAFIHELAHFLDPNFKDNVRIADSQYDTQAERVATARETAVATDLGEPTRDNHLVTETINTANATEHTQNNGNGTATWVRQESNGTISTGQTVPVSSPPPPPPDTGGGGGGGGGGCVATSSFLPDGTTAGEIVVGAQMELADERTLEPGQGIVSYSQRKLVPGFRITTESGVTLVCSDSAPIPTPQGLVLAPELLGKQVAVRHDDAQGQRTGWELVTAVDAIGEIAVQHITVGDKCFWAGEKKNGYILHHNLKDAGGGGGGGDGDDDPWWDEWDDLTATLPTTDHTSVSLVGVTPANGPLTGPAHG